MTTSPRPSDAKTPRPGPSGRHPRRHGRRAPCTPTRPRGRAEKTFPRSRSRTRRPRPRSSPLSTPPTRATTSPSSADSSSRPMPPPRPSAQGSRPIWLRRGSRQRPRKSRWRPHVAPSTPPAAGSRRSPIASPMRPVAGGSPRRSPTRTPTPPCARLPRRMPWPIATRGSRHPTSPMRPRRPAPCGTPPCAPPSTSGSATTTRRCGPNAIGCATSNWSSPARPKTSSI